MYFKAIELQGFKSFAGKTRLEFKRGLTAIVGPNGSGKSNISDAMRWVMGETSAKSLRGGKMEDVIFSGTDARKPLSYASVTIELDNRDGTLAGYDDLVTVRRRVYRSGESEYSINGNICRLRDINELFMDTGLGRDGYSIIGQGKIDEIISSNPIERRYVLEEAFGIAKSRYRRDEAVKKLKHTDENLERVEDIILEIGGRLEVLEAQSVKARKYLDLREEQKKLEINLWLGGIEGSKEELAEVMEKYNVVQGQMTDLQQTIANAEQETTQMKQDLRDVEGSVDQSKARLYESKSDIQQTDSDIALCESAIGFARQNILRLEGEMQQIALRIKEADGGHAQFDHQIKDAQQTEEKARAIMERATAENQTILAAIREKEDALIKLQQQAQETEQTLAKDGEKLSARRLALSQQTMQLTEAAEQIVRGEKMLEKLPPQSGINPIKADSIGALKIMCDQTVHAIESLLQRKQLLSALEEKLDGYQRGVKAVMNSGLKGLCGPVGQLVKTDGKYAAAIEAAMGGAVQNVVTQDETAAKAAIAYLKETKQGRVTFLPVTTVKGQTISDTQYQNEHGYIGIASTLIQCDEIYSGVVAFLLGRTLVVNDIDNATKLARKYSQKLRIVTLGGELISPGGSITGGAYRHGGGEAFSRGKELVDIDKQIVEKQRDIAGIKQECAAFETELKDVETKLAQFADQMEQKRQRLADGSSQNAQNDLAIAQQRYTDAMHTYARVTIEYNESKQQLEMLCQMAEDRTKQTEQLQSQHRDKQAQIRDQQTEIETKQLEIQEKQKIKEQLNGAITQYEQMIESLNAKREAMFEKIEGKEQSTKDLRQENYDLLEEKGRVEALKTKAETKEDTLLNLLWEEYELTYHSALAYKMDIGPRTKAESTLGSLKNKIKQLGNINIDAIEEYRQSKERFDFLTAQKEDLLAGIDEITKLIKQLENTMETMFEKQFALLDKSFNETFKLLFEGGRASLNLTDGDNLLTSGVEIIAQPPGKNLQNITLLSGGEKALCAIALIFGILKMRPSHFCIFDEIEAALDDINVYKFADYLKSMLKNTQFIVITHRKGTMEAADMLYGVTMQEKGISSVLMLDTERKETDGTV